MYRYLKALVSNQPLDYERPTTPNSDRSSNNNEPPEFVSRPPDFSDEDDYGTGRSLPRKKGGYDSRIEQILYENPDLQIVITDAGKSSETGGGYIVYTIRTGVSSPPFVWQEHDDVLPATSQIEKLGACC